ncbi:hypothetical protein Agub_g3020, partial [Astrephomene gubernaculifera]
PNSRGEFGRTPLWRAAFLGQEEAVGALLEGGADPRLGNDGGELPAHVAPPALRQRLEEWDTGRTEELRRKYEDDVPCSLASLPAPSRSQWLHSPPSRTHPDCFIGNPSFPPASCFPSHPTARCALLTPPPCLIPNPWSIVDTPHPPPLSPPFPPTPQSLRSERQGAVVAAAAAAVRGAEGEVAGAEEAHGRAQQALKHARMELEKRIHEYDTCVEEKKPEGLTQ